MSKKNAFFWSAFAGWMSFACFSTREFQINSGKRQKKFDLPAAQIYHLSQTDLFSGFLPAEGFIPTFLSTGLWR